jgi:hypothetical protein
MGRFFADNSPTLLLQTSDPCQKWSVAANTSKLFKDVDIAITVGLQNLTFHGSCEVAASCATPDRLHNEQL